jgi:Bacterial SH3 domain
MSNNCKILPSLVASSLSISLAISVATPAKSQSQSEINSGVRTRSCAIANITSGQLALRATPGGRVIGRLNNGDRVTKFGRGLPRWVSVIVDSSNRSGYVSSRYLSCESD